MKKHIAKTNTDQRCVVIYMQIPQREDHALVCVTDTLPPRLEQAVMEIVESPEGQASPQLANVLGRRLLGDTGQTVLESLHNQNMLRAIPVDDVIMMPLPNRPFSLRSIIEAMGGTVPTNNQTVVDASMADNKLNPYGNIPAQELASGQQGTAQGLLREAAMLEAEASSKRARAYFLAPELEPAPVDHTELMAELVTMPAEEPKKPARKKATPPTK